MKCAKKNLPMATTDDFDSKILQNFSSHISINCNDISINCTSNESFI